MVKTLKLLIMFLGVIFLTGCDMTLRLSNITTEAIQSNDTFIVEVYNNSNSSKTVSIKVEFLDKNKKVIKKVEQSLESAPPKAKMAVVLDEEIKQGSYDTYKITTKSEKDIYNNLHKNLILTKKEGKKDIKYKLENNGDYRMDYIFFVMVYYKDNIPVSYKWEKHDYLKAGSESSIEFDANKIEYDEAVLYYNAYANEK